MAYHISNLGAFGEQVRGYADQAGFVPQAGDRPEGLAYERGGDAEAVWEGFVDAAVTATERAEGDLAAGGSSHRAPRSKRDPTNGRLERAGGTNLLKQRS